MKKKTISGLLIFIIALVTSAGCIGLNRDAPTLESTNSPLQPTTAVVKIISQGDGRLINGINVTLVLPPGVTVKAVPDDGNTRVLIAKSGVVSTSGVSAGANAMMPVSTYTAASAAAPGKVIIHLADANGFGTGEFVTVTCDLAAGSLPRLGAADFSVINFEAVDLNGAPISGLTATVTADIH